MTKEERDENRMKYTAKKGFPYIDDLLKNKDFRDRFKEKYENGKILFIDASELFQKGRGRNILLHFQKGEEPFWIHFLV